MPETTSLTALAERLELWPVDRLRPYERNPRTHSADQVAQIAASILTAIRRLRAPPLCA